MVQNLIVLTCILLISVFNTYAQFNETIRTGRPGQAIGPFTLGKGVFQNQTGFDLSNAQPQDASFEDQSYDINSVFRYGLIENFEFSGVLTYGFDERKLNDMSESSNRLKQFDLGVRTNFVEGKGLLPSMGFQYRMRIPAGPSSEKEKYVSSVITFVTANRLSNKFGFNTNWIVRWNGNTGEPTAAYVFNLAYSITDKWGTMAEYYGTFTDAFWYGNVDAGFSYLVNNDIQLDTFGGIGGFGSDFDTYFVSVGISWRIHNRS